VSVLGDVRDINRKLGNVEKQIGGFGKKMSGLGKAVAGAFAAAGAVALFKDIVSGASNAQQSIGATETIFGKYAKTVISTSDAAATKFGLSANEYRENANQLGAVLGNLGVSQDQLAGKTQSLIGIGSNLAATFGGTTKDAVGALTAAYKGEFDQLEKYGVSIKAADVATLLHARGQDKLTGAAKKAAEQQAVSDLIAKQTAKSQGAFAKETDTLAHQQQVLAAKVQNVKDKIGSALLPILTRVASFVSDKVLPALERFGAWFSENIMPKVKQFASALGADLLPKVKEFGTFLTGTVVPALQALVGWLVQNQSWLMPIAVGITAIAVAWKAWTIATQAWAAITKAATAVQAAFNAVMAMNPIGLLVLAIVGLVAAIVYLWKTNEGFRETVLAVWAAIKGGVTGAVNAVKSVVTSVWNAIKSATSSVWNFIKSLVVAYINTVKAVVTGALNIIKSAWSSAWNGAKALISTVWNGIKSGVSNGIDNVLSLVRGIKGRITGALSGAGSWLVSVGKNVVQGLISGIRSLAGSVTSALLNLLPGPLRKFASKLGIHSPSTVFKGFGKNIGEGLVIGIENMGSKVARTASGLAGAVAEGFEAPRLSLAGSVAASGGYGNTYTITVNALDPQSASRGVMDAIREHERMNGNGWRS
jgi:phage-related protein